MKTLVLLPLAALLITASCTKQTMPAPAHAATTASSAQRLYNPPTWYDTMPRPWTPIAPPPMGTY